MPSGARRFNGETSVVRDFGGIGIARGIHVAGGRVAVVVGGRVSFSVDPALGPVRWDSAG